MRIVIFFLLLYCIDLSGQLTSNLSAYYKLDETSGVSVYNAIGGGKITGTVTNADVGVDGKLSNALDFDGSGDAVTLKDTITLQGYNSKMSFSCWIYLRAYPAVRYHIIGGETQSLGLTITPSGALKAWAIGAYDAVESSLTVPLNQWTFVGMSWVSTPAGVKDSINYQINGTYEQVLSVSTSFSVKSGASSMYIGALNGDGSTYCINAILDEIGIWKGVSLDESKFDSLYNSGAGLSYPFAFIPPEQTQTEDRKNKILFLQNYYAEKIVPYTIPNIPPSLISGIYDIIGPEDYDGVCESGEDWVTDADCISDVWNLAPLRKIRDSSDYSTVYHIDPDANDVAEDGSVAHPYNSLNDITLANNIAVLFKRGTVYDHGTTINVSQSDILFGSYGSLSQPQAQIIRENANQRVFYITGASLKTFRDLYISNPYPSENTRPVSQGNTAALDVSDNVEIDVFNCEMRYGWFGFRSVGIANKIRVINCNIHDVLTEGCWLRASNYIEVRFTKLYNNNAFWFDQPLRDTEFGANTGSTGDGLELSGHWKQGLIANNLIDRGTTGNKSTIMYHNDPVENPSHQGSITAYNILVSPRNEQYDDEHLVVGPNFNSIFINNLCIASPYSSTKPNGMALLYPGSTIAGNVFKGFTRGIWNGSGRVMANNTFIDNDYCVYTTGSITIPVWANNITYGNTNVFSSGITVTSNQNNLSSNPLFNPIDTNGFEILANSPAIGAANSVLYRDYDIYGTEITLPQDIGAYTYTGPRVLLIGNSVMSPIDDLFIADGDNYDVSSIAVSGHTIVQQTAEWNKLSAVVKASYDYIIVMVGLNDPGASPYIANYQTLINSINAGKKVGAKVIASTMTPADPSLVNPTKWYALNAAIMGLGSTPITGIDVRTNRSTLDMDADNNMYLDDAYDSGDGIHPNNAGDQLIKDNFLEILDNLEGQIPLPSDFTVYNNWDFETEALGEWTNAEILNYFNVSEVFYPHGNASIVGDVINGETTKVLRMNHAAMQTGDGFEINVKLDDDYNELWLSYNWKFDPEFNSTHGGKLPGLGGSPVNWASDLSCPTGSEGFRAHNLFEYSGWIVSYHYDRTTGTCPWAVNQDSVVMNFGNWYNVTQRLVLNTFTGGVANADGIKEVWIDGKLALKETNLKLMGVEHDTLKIDAFRLTHFYGGSTTPYLPIRNTYALIDNIKVYIPANDPIYGTRGTHGNNTIISTPDEITDRTFHYDYFINTEQVISQPNSLCINRTYLIDAGAGNTVTFTAASTGTYIGSQDYMYFFDGNQTDSPSLYIAEGPRNVNGLTVTSTGRYMYLRYVTSNDATATGWTGSITFE
jgi:lysophospholipase L1-like esterase